MGSALCVQSKSGAVDVPVQHECTESASADHEDLHSTSNLVSCIAKEDAVATQATASSSQASSVEVQASQLTAHETEILCSSEALNKQTTYLKVWDDVEIEKVFDKYKEQAGLDQKSALLSGAKLQAALQELGIHPAGSTERADLDEFKRMARQPNEAEQWFQMIPFASLLSRSLSKTTLRDLGNLQTDEIALGLQVFSQGVQVILERRLKELRKLMSEEKNFQNLHGENESKFGGVLEGGSVDDFHRGLSDRLGYPHTQIEKGMRDEHCEESLGCDVEFTTMIFGITTTPKKEYEIASEPDKCPEEDKFNWNRTEKIRDVKKADELLKLEIATKAKLNLFEVKAIVLYSGPMLQIYNTMLRQPGKGKYLADLCEKFKAANNTFSTTIHVIVSATVKLARTIKIPSGLKLYRGIGKELPPSFYAEDDFGRKGYMEWGFMSATSNEHVARQYSGAKEGEKIGMVLCLEASSIDRGACIKEFSQYPTEVEYLYVPCSFMEPTGLKRLEETKDGVDFLWMIHVRVNVNLKSFTVEELKGRKKAMHLSDLKSFMMDSEKTYAALHKHMKDSKKTIEGIEAHMEDRGSKLLILDVKSRIQELRSEGRTLFERHHNTAEEAYSNDEIYASMLAETLAYRNRAAQVVFLTNKELGAIKSASDSSSINDSSNSKLCDQKIFSLKTGRPIDATRGLDQWMRVNDCEFYVRLGKMVEGIKEEVDEFAAVDPINGLEVKELLHYILYEKTSEKKYSNGIRDKGRGSVDLQHFVNHDNAREAHLKPAEVVALRLYTTAAFKHMNNPLRDSARYEGEIGCPLPVLTSLAVSGIKKLRALQLKRLEKEIRKEDEHGLILWRGMQNVEVPRNFMDEGGTELAFMSTTSDLHVAVQYSLSKQSLLFKILAKDFMVTGADVQWLSAFPFEAEVLYPPLTYLKPTGRVQKVQVNGEDGVMGLFEVVEVELTIS